MLRVGVLSDILKLDKPISKVAKWGTRMPVKAQNTAHLQLFVSSLIYSWRCQLLHRCISPVAVSVFIHHAAIQSTLPATRLKGYSSKTMVYIYCSPAVLRLTHIPYAWKHAMPLQSGNNIVHCWQFYMLPLASFLQNTTRFAYRPRISSNNTSSYSTYEYNYPCYVLR